jgi:Domain of unknown function (DUF4347)
MARTSSLIFVDSSIPFAHFRDDETFAHAEKIILDANRNGIEQITDILKQRYGVQELYIIAQGNRGSLKLGSSYLTIFDLDRYAWSLQAWGESLVPNAAIYLCGIEACGTEAGETEACGIEAGELDKAFMQRLSLLTGAKIITFPSPTDYWTLAQSAEFLSATVPVKSLQSFAI